MSEVFYSVKARRRVRDVTLAAEMAGWQLQYAGVKGRGAHIFRVVDTRDQRDRLRDPKAMGRRVWEMTYDNLTRHAGHPDGGYLSEVYPEIFKWAKAEMAAYWVRAGLMSKREAAKKAREAAKARAADIA